MVRDLAMQVFGGKIFLDGVRSVQRPQDKNMPCCYRSRKAGTKCLVEMRSERWM